MANKAGPGCRIVATIILVVLIMSKILSHLIPPYPTPSSKFLDIGRPLWIAQLRPAGIKEAVGR